LREFCYHKSGSIFCPNKDKKTMPNGRQIDNWIQNLIIIYPF